MLRPSPAQALSLFRDCSYLRLQVLRRVVHAGVVDRLAFVHPAVRERA